MSIETGPETPQPEAPALAPETQPDTQPEPAGEAIPYDRFKSVVDKKNAAIEAQQAAEARVTALEAEYAAKIEALQKDATTHQETAAEALQRLEAERLRGHVYKSGVSDDDLVDLALFKYGSAEADAEGNRPAFGDWYDAWKADKSYFSKPTATTVREPVSTGNAGAKKVDAGDGTDSKAIADMTPNEYRAWRERQKK